MAAKDAREFFDYTSGRWIYNESLRLSERRLVFNVSELKRAAASSINRSENEVADIHKVAEGGFNRVFEITMKGGPQIIARLPYPSTQPKRYALASEVATLDLVRAHGVPVPQVYGYCPHPENPVGAEYLMMEKVKGRSLADQWYNITEKQRIKLISDVVEIGAKLFSIDLPASGSVYYAHDLSQTLERVEIPYSKDVGSEKLCVGPDTALMWWFEERSSINVNRGPHRTSMDILEAAAKKELAWLQTYGKPRPPFDCGYREFTNFQKSDPGEHVKNLEKYLKIAPYLVPNEKWLHKPTIRHSDLQPNNIFISDDLEAHDLKIAALIDWQHCSARPLFLQAGIPKYFQNYGDEESENLIEPTLPDDFAELDEEDQDMALEQYRRRQLHFYYLGTTAGMNKSHFRTCMYDMGLFRRRLFTHACEPWEGNNNPLKADLIRLTKVWPELSKQHGSASTTACPISFTTEESEECLKIESQQMEVDTLSETIRNHIGISSDGWLNAEDYDVVLERARNAKARCIELAETEWEKEMTEKHWPYEDHNEKE